MTTIRRTEDALSDVLLWLTLIALYFWTIPTGI
jgi:hypothetical protein